MNQDEKDCVISTWSGDVCHRHDKNRIGVHRKTLEALSPNVEWTGFVLIWNWLLKLSKCPGTVVFH